MAGKPVAIIMGSQSDWQTMKHAADTLTAPDILPGFSVPVADLFRRPGEPAQAPPPPV